MILWVGIFSIFCSSTLADFVCKDDHELCPMIHVNETFCQRFGDYCPSVCSENCMQCQDVSATCRKYTAQTRMCDVGNVGTRCPKSCRQCKRKGCRDAKGCGTYVTRNFCDIYKSSCPSLCRPECQGCTDQLNCAEFAKAKSLCDIDSVQHSCRKACQICTDESSISTEELNEKSSVSEDETEKPEDHQVPEVTVTEKPKSDNVAKFPDIFAPHNDAGMLGK